MRRILYAILCLMLCVAICACGTQQASSPTDTDEQTRAGGYWSADYDETFNYKPLYAVSSPYSAVGSNLVPNSSFDGCSVQRGGGNAVGAWVAHGAFDTAYSVTSDGVDGSACLTYNRAQQGRSASYASIVVEVKPETTYVLTAKMRSQNMSNPMISVVGLDDDSFISEIAAGIDDYWEDASCSFYSGANSSVQIRFIGNAYEYDFRECVSGVGYLDDLCLYETGGQSAEIVPDKYRMDDSSYRYEKTSGWSAWKWGVSELYWYNNARVFSYNSIVDVWCPNSSYFTVSGRPKEGQIGYFGFEYHWEHQLEKGYAYQFNMQMPQTGEDPDFITVNDKIVWTNNNDGLVEYAGKKTITFEYVPEKNEYVRIRFICETGIQRGESTACARRLLPPPYGNWSEQPMTCYRTATLSVPDYVKYDFHKNTEFIACDAEETALMLRPEIDAPIDGDEIEDIPDVDYKVSDIAIMDEANVIWDGVGEVVGRLGVDCLVYAPQDKRENVKFDDWAKKAIEAGVDHAVIYTVMPRSYTVESADEGEYIFTQVVNMMSSEEELDIGLTATSECVNRWLELVPDGKVTVVFCELESHFGAWTSNDFAKTNLASFPGFEGVAEGGVNAYRLASQFLEKVHTDLKAKLTKPDQVEFLSNSSRACFDLNNLAVESCDIIVGKGTSRCNHNIVTAIARGTAETKGIRFGQVWDTFDRDYHYGITNDAIVSGFLSMFHNGVDLILSEVGTMNNTEKSLNNQALGWYDGVRYVRTHPQVGETQVKIGILRGEGDEWVKLAAKSAAWEQNINFSSREMLDAFSKSTVLSKWQKAAAVYRTGKQVAVADTYLGDFALLDVVFTNWGNGAQTDMQRQLTGTPYGPANFLRDSISLEQMKKYDTLIYCGRGQTITEEAIKNLEEYVKQGGNLIMAVGQLKDEECKLVTDSFMGVSLTKQKTVESVPYYYLESEDAEIIERHKNGDPQALMVTYGEGRCALFSGEYLSSYDTEVVRETIAGILDENKNVYFSKKADYIEYTPNIKGESLVLPFINQGRGLFPSGNGKDHGVWTGNVAVDLTDFGLKADEVEVYRVNQKADGSEALTMTEIDFEIEDNSVVFAIEVALIDEIVIGPKGQAESDFFS